MESYLYVHEEQFSYTAHAVPESAWKERYFISYPFCGVKWFSTKPKVKDKHITMNQFDATNTTSGWVMGGSLRVLMVKSANSAVKLRGNTAGRGNNVQSSRKNIFIIYPFDLHLRTDAFGDIVIKLGAETKVLRNEWLEEFNRCIYMQQYLHACTLTDAAPTRSACFSTREETGNLAVENLRLNVSVLSSIINFRKLIEPQGSELLSVQLSNVHLIDDHMSYVVSMMQYTPLLESLSLTFNKITDIGAKTLADAIPFCPKLDELNLASNLIGDKGMIDLASALSREISLTHLDVSRNRLTKECTRDLCMYLGGHGSLLRRVNFCGNEQLGEGIAGLAVLLMTIEPSKLESIDLSYCGVTDDVLVNLAKAAVQCKSLRVLALHGNDVRPESLSHLLEASEEHQVKYGKQYIPSSKKTRSWVFLDIQLFGLMENPHRFSSKANMSAIFPTSMLHNRDERFNFYTPSTNELKSAFTHLGSNSYLTEVVLRRRPKVFFNARNGLTIDRNIKPDQDLVSPHDLYFVEMTLACCPTDPKSPYETLHCLAHWLGVDHRQFLVIGETPPDFMGSMNVSCLILDYQLAVNTEVIHDSETTITDACTIFKALIKLSSNSHSMLGRLGIQNVSFFANVDKKSVAPADKELINTYQMFEIKNCLMSTSGLGTEYIPDLVPNEASTTVTQQEASDASDENSTMKTKNTTLSNLVAKSLDPDDDELLFDESYDEKTASEGAKMAKEVLSRSLYIGSDQDKGEKWYFDPHYDHKGERKMPGLASFDSNSLHWHVYDEKDPDLEDYIEDSIEKLNDRMLFVLKTVSHQDHHVGQFEDSAGTALFNDFAMKFWYFTYSMNTDREPLVKKTLRAGLSANYLFRGVELRKMLCDAMYRREEKEMENIIANMEKERIDGGTALECAKKLLIELEVFHRTSHQIAQLTEVEVWHMDIIEAYLVNCGRLGYSGEYMVRASKLREEAVRNGVESKDLLLIKHINHVKMKARLANCMICRDMPALHETIRVIEHDIDRELYEGMDETITARWLIQEMASIDSMLIGAEHSSSLKDVEHAIAKASYIHAVHGENFQPAFDRMIELGGDVIPIYRRLARAIATGNQKLLTDTQEFFQWVGWRDTSCMSPQLISKLVSRRSSVIMEEDTRESLMKTALAIKQGTQGPVGVILRTLRTSVKLNLDHHPQHKMYVGVLQKFLKKNAPNVAKIEEELRTKIFSGHLPTVNDVACSRDEKLFVLVANSKALMNLWLNMLNGVVKAQTEETYGNAVLFNGFLEKAGSMSTKDMDRYSNITNWDYICQEHNLLSRDAICRIADNEKQFMRKLKGWRRRYFVLQSKALTYYTRAGGEKKGTIPLKGALIRAIHQDSIPSSMMKKQRQFCILIQAGKDVSGFDPSFIDEAKIVVEGLYKLTMRKKLKAAIQADNCTVAKKVLDLAKKMEITNFCSPSLLDDARESIRAHSLFKIMQNMRIAVQEMDKNLMKETISQASGLGIDPDYSLMNKATILVDRSAIELLILRARNTIHIQSGRYEMINQLECAFNIPTRADVEVKFRETMSQISRIESTRYSTREKKLICAVIIQKAAYAVMKRMYEGDHFSLCIRTLRAALSKCTNYHVYSEGTQLIKLILLLHTNDSSGAYDEHAFNDNRSELLATLKYIISDDFYLADPHEYAYSSQYTIDKYKYLAHIKTKEFKETSFAAEKEAKRLRLVKNTIADTLKQTSIGKFISSFQPDYSLIMKWQGVIGGLPFKPLVYGLQEESEKQAYKTFELLQCYMGDKPITMMSRATWKKVPYSPSRKVLETNIACELLSHGLDDPRLKDELYMQLCKQLNQEKMTSSLRKILHQSHSTISRLKGWILFSLYLHSFSPGNSLVPYMRNFIHNAIVESSKERQEYEDSLVQSIEEYESKEHARIATWGDRFGINDPNQAYQAYRQMKDVIKHHFDGYLFKTDEYKMSELEINLDALESVTKIAAYCGKLLDNVERNYQMGIKTMETTLDKQVVFAVISRMTIQMDVVLTTGSIYRIPLRFGDMETPFYLLHVLYGRLVATSTDKEKIDMGLKCEYDEFSRMSEDEQKDILQSVFRGFAFYSLPHKDGDEVDLLQIPVQPDESAIIDYCADMFWDILIENRDSLPNVADYDVPYQSSARVLASMLGIPEDINFLKSIGFSRGKDAVEDDEDEYQFTGRISESRYEQQDHYYELPQGIPRNVEEHMMLVRQKYENDYEQYADVWGYHVEDQDYYDNSEQEPRLVKRVMFRRRLISSSERFEDELSIFGVHTVDSPSYDPQRVWSNWIKESDLQESMLKTYLAKTSRRRRKMELRRKKNPDEEFAALDSMLPPPPELFPMPLPYDYLRVDILFSEETRYVNSRLYHASPEQQAYLIAMQMILSWIDEDKYNTNAPKTIVEEDPHSYRLGEDIPYGGAEVDGLALHSDLSIRPSVRFSDGYGMCHRYRKMVDVVDFDSNSSMAENTNGTGLIGTKNDDTSSSVSSDIQKSPRRQNSFSSSKRYSQKDYATYLEQLQDEEESSSEEVETDSDDYDTDDYASGGDEDKYIPEDFIKPTLPRGSMTSQGRASITSTGGDRVVDDDDDDDDDDGDSRALSDIFESVNTERTPHTVVDHSKKLDPSVLSPSYLETLEVKLGNLGLHVSDNLMHLIVTRMKEFQTLIQDLCVSAASHRFRYYMKRAYLAYIAAWPLFGCHFFQGQLQEIVAGTTGNLESIIAIGSGGFYLLEPTTWNLIFFTPLTDITSCSIEPLGIEHIDAPRTSRVFCLTVNDMDMQIITAEAYEMRRLIDANVIEKLAYGSFSHGTEGGEDILDTHFNRVMKSNDQKVLMEYFRKVFVLLPAPPKPPVLNLAQTHFDPPRSRHQIMIERRAEREAEELEQMKFDDKTWVDKMKEELQDRYDQYVRDRTALETTRNVHKRQLNAEEQDTENALRTTMMSGAMSRRKEKTQVQLSQEGEQRKKVQERERINKIITPLIDALARGYSSAESTLRSDNNKAVQLQALYGHGQINFNHASYPLLSNGPQAIRMEELHPSNMRPVGKQWPVGRVKNDARDAAIDKLQSLENKSMDEVNESSSDNGSSSEEESTQVIQGLKRDRSRRITETQKMGRMRLESAIMNTQNAMNLHGTKALTEDVVNNDSENPRESFIVKPSMPDVFVDWMDSSKKYYQTQQERRNNRKKSMGLFYTSAWCKDMTEEERGEILESNGYVYQHGEEELYGIKDDMSSMSGSVRSETFLGKHSLFENFSEGFKMHNNGDIPRVGSM